MREQENHLSDETLLLFVDGEASGHQQEHAIRKHLEACWSCRLRLRDLEAAIAEVARIHRTHAEAVAIPPPDGPRALLKARLRELASHRPGEVAPLSPGLRLRRYARAFALSATVAGFFVLLWPELGSGERTAIPRIDLTPGAVRTVAAAEVCAVDLTGNAQVMPAVQHQVFAKYGMPNAEQRAFEVDYLITPALGGSDDIRNLWPQPYGGSRWNAYVKDALEDRLREMVCSGQLDLATAQRDIAVNWIAAYRKYFHTRDPLPQHVRPERTTE